MEHLKDLSKEELLKLVDVYANNWLAHDGCWFLAAEESLGMERAIELDARSWERFSVAEAKRIMGAFRLPPGGGLDVLQKALWLRLYAAVNPQRIERTDSTLVLTMLDCRVQKDRKSVV